MDSRTILAAIDTDIFPFKTITTSIPGGYEEKITNDLTAAVGCKHTFYEAGSDLLSGEAVMELTRDAIAITDGMRGASYSALTEFTARKLHERGYDIVMTGHAGELAKLDEAYNFSITGKPPANWDGTFLSWSYDRMSSAGRRGIDVQQLFNPEFATIINESPRESLRQSLDDLDPELPFEQKVSYMFLHELFRKRGYYAMAVSRAYSDIRLPFLDDDYLEQVLRAPLHLRLNHVIHRSIIQRYRPKLLDIPLSQTRVRLDASRFERWTRGASYYLLRRLGFYKRDVAEDFFTKLGNTQYFEEVLLSEQSLDRGFINARQLQKLLDNYKGGNRRAHSFLHLLAIVELWHKMFIDQE